MTYHKNNDKIKRIINAKNWYFLIIKIKDVMVLTTVTIEKIRSAEQMAEETEKSAVKNAELTIEKAKHEAAAIVEKAKAAGEAHLAEKLAEAQKAADENSAQNAVAINDALKAMDDAVASKYNQAVSKVKQMLISD